MQRIKEKISISLQNFCEQQFQKRPDLKLFSLQNTRPEFEGELTIVVFPFKNLLHISIDEIGEIFGKYLLDNFNEIGKFNLVKGFLNLSLSDSYLIELFKKQIIKDDYGLLPKTSHTVLVEYASPNTNKPLHLGHLRNIFLGHSVANILKAGGNEVKKVQIINDRGIHICKSMLAWLRYGNNETPESSGLKGDHLVGKYYVIFDQKYKEEIADLTAEGKEEKWAKTNAPILLEAQDMLRKWESADPETLALWKKMNGWVYLGFDETYRTMKVDFDKLYYESETYLKGKEVVETGLQKGKFFKKEDGSVWIDLSQKGLDEKLLLRSDGTAVYITQDMGTAVLRKEDFPAMTQMIYTVGNEQDYHFKVLFEVLKAMEYDWAERCFHLSYGMVDLPSGKMKSREGTVVDADDLMFEMYQTAKAKAEELGKLEELSVNEKEELYWKIGLAALKYFILKVDPKKKMLFNPEESVDFSGNTGPFIQYAHARICAIERRAEGENLENSFPEKLEEKERNLIVNMARYEEIVAEASENFSPAIVANYTYELVKAFNQFYQQVSIFNDGDTEKSFRINLSKACGKIIKKSMLLLGIEVPERM